MPPQLELVSLKDTAAQVHLVSSRQPVKGRHSPSPLLPSATGRSYGPACFYQPWTQPRNQTSRNSDSSKRTSRAVWKNVIYHSSTHDRHHSLTRSQSVTGGIHAHKPGAHVARLGFLQHFGIGAKTQPAASLHPLRSIFWRTCTSATAATGSQLDGRAAEA